jgi:cell division septation protein DedD
VGINYQYNRLRIAFAIPRIFDAYTASEKSFNTSGIAQMDNTISSISYSFPIGTRFSFEPWVTYRTFQNLDPQFEALASFKVEKLLWIGGSYRQDYGAAAFLGFSIKEKLKIGYAYEFATDQSDKLGNGSHEAQLILRIGKRQFTRPQIETKATKPEEAVAQANALKEKIEQEAAVVDEIPSDMPAPEQEITPSSTEDNTNAIPSSTAPAESVTSTPAQADPSPEVGEQPKQAVTNLKGEALPPGHYVVVGAFQSDVNARNYANTLKRSGYPANVAFHPEKGYYIVHMINAPTMDEAKLLRDKYRQMSRYSFRDTWILSIE